MRDGGMMGMRDKGWRDDGGWRSDGGGDGEMDNGGMGIDSRENLPPKNTHELARMGRVLDF